VRSGDGCVVAVWFGRLASAFIAELLDPVGARSVIGMRRMSGKNKSTPIYWIKQVGWMLVLFDTREVHNWVVEGHSSAGHRSKPIE
jgi:hypothetical protein